MDYGLPGKPVQAESNLLMVEVEYAGYPPALNQRAGMTPFRFVPRTQLPFYPGNLHVA